MNASTSAAAHTVTIQLDGQAHTVPAGSCLADLLVSMGHSEQAVATAVNQSFVARSKRAITVLDEGDQVMLFQPIVGG